MTTWFISDLHLSAQRPAIMQAFLHWLQHTACHAEALYILGDFFEVWVGDDVLTDPYYGSEFQPVIAALQRLATAGVHLYLMHGNRDFLLGEDFARICGMTLLPDPTPLDVGATRLLLSHGDALCTDDTAYQQFRQQVRQPAWQQQFLAQPLSARLAYAGEARAQSRRNKAMQATDIMDVNAEAVCALIRQYQYPTVLLHGHTHRPDRHRLNVDGHACERWVLGDWHTEAVVYRLEAGHLQAVNLPLAAWANTD